MCGRFTLRMPARDLIEIFELRREPEMSPRYNIAPTQHVAVVRQDGTSREFSVKVEDTPINSGFGERHVSDRQADQTRGQVHKPKN
jgi:putative SOS response-associated peptidase YedK